MPVTKSGFKEAFNRKNKEVLADIFKLEQTIQEIAALEGSYERFLPLLDKVQKDFAAATGGVEDTRGGYKKAVKNLKEVQGVLDKALKGAKAQQEFKKTKIGGDGKMPEVNLYTGSIPGFDKMPKDKQQKVQAEVEEKIKRGKELCDKMFSPDFDPRKARRPTREDLADFMWYTKVMAENQQNEPSAKGAITIPDPDNKIRKYFSRTKGMYYRVSSHIEEQAKKTEHNPEGGKTARGVDFYDSGADDTEHLLPYGMKTALLQSVDAGGGNRLYVKMETQSSRIGPKSIKGTETGDKQRGHIAADIPRSIAHGKNLFFPEKDKTGLSAFREQTPAETVKEYDDLMNDLKLTALMDDLSATKAAEILRRGYKPLPTKAKKLAKTQQKEKSKGSNRIRIFQMVKNMQDVLADKTIDDGIKGTIQARLDKLLDDYPDATERFGSEAVMTAQDLHQNPVDEDEEETSDTDSQMSDEEEEERLVRHRKRVSTTWDDIFAMISDDALSESGGVKELQEEREQARKMAPQVLEGEADFNEFLSMLEDVGEGLPPKKQPSYRDKLAELDAMLDELEKLNT